MPLAALAFFEIGNGPELLILMFLPGVIGLAALVGAIALFVGASRAPKEKSRMGWYIGMAILLVIALGIGTCYGVVLVGINTPGW